MLLIHILISVVCNPLHTFSLLPFPIPQLTDNQRDSASEPDDEEAGEEWLKTYDSARRCYYWQNYATNVITYDEPEEELAHEKNLVGKRVKVYWVVQVRFDPSTTCVFFDNLLSTLTEQMESIRFVLLK